MKKGLSSIMSLVLVSGILFVLGLLANFVTYTFADLTLNKWLQVITGVPAENLVFPNILWMMILPFLATGAILIFLLDKIMRVRDEYALIIAIAWAGILFNPAYPVYLYVLLPFYGAAGVLAPITFVIVFLFGLWNWYKKSRYYQTSTLAEFEEDIRQKNDEIRNLEKKLKNEKDDTKRGEIMEKINTTRKQLSSLKKQGERFEGEI